MHLGVQKDFNSCGVFVCLHAERLSRGLEPPFADVCQEHVSHYRQQLVISLLTGTLRLPPVAPKGKGVSAQRRLGRRLR